MFSFFPLKSIRSMMMGGVCALGLLLSDGALFAGKREALVIGVHEYDKNQLRSLPFAESDSVALSERLRILGFDRVVLMTQSAGAKTARLLPTAANLRETIEGFLAPAKWKEDDTVFIVLSGHGVQFKDEETAYFCPMDAHLSKRETLIDLNDIYRKLEKCPAAFRLLIADCCRNDPQSDFSRARAEVNLESVTRPQRVSPPGGVAAFFSCAAGQKAYESSDLKQGIFTHFLLEGLSGSKADYDKNQKVDLGELVKYTADNVTGYVSNEFGESTIQVPELVGKTRGSVPIVELAKTLTATSSSTSTPAPLPVLDPQRFAGGKASDSWEGNTLKMKFRWCPDGTFTMGSPRDEIGRFNGGNINLSVATKEDQVEVELTGFWIGQFEVTQGEWNQVMGTTVQEQAGKARNAVKQDNQLAGETSRRPMYFVNHADATDFAKKYTEQERKAGKLPAGWEYRLPTEAQWEYACRAETKTATAFGKTLSSNQANFNGKMPYPIYRQFDVERGPNEERTVEVGKYPANAWGLHDMHGNVSEWCRDFYQFKLPGERDPEIAETHDSVFYRCVRGGNWRGTGEDCRSAARGSARPEIRSNTVGFRLAAVQVKSK